MTNIWRIFQTEDFETQLKWNESNNFLLSKPKFRNCSQQHQLQSPATNITNPCWNSTVVSVYDRCSVPKLLKKINIFPVVMEATFNQFSEQDSPSDFQSHFYDLFWYLQADSVFSWHRALPWWRKRLRLCRLPLFSWLLNWSSTKKSNIQINTEKILELLWKPQVHPR